MREVSDQQYALRCGRSDRELLFEGLVCFLALFRSHEPLLDQFGTCSTWAPLFPLG